ncbi:hypothetical protein DAPPUDRAFT_318815 [Daphnia pulex]|uniref:Uncharacterized protein n=1 Tax=Daphnia pulex TaxID=6669 RepID=E9GJR1_DAPPU|nr:hypothetical protein DAPPUDRAFT_318815 [Daphnia pulex]|eukprot:EFX80271.1 hypothetical protein DAPPUDRAFT_318815 [Daphnia pulex]
MFSKNIWPKTSWMEYDVAHVFNKTEETWLRLVKASKKATSLQRGDTNASQWFDSDANLGRAKDGESRSLWTRTQKQKRALSAQQQTVPHTPKRQKTIKNLLDSASKTASAAEATTLILGDADTEKIAPQPIFPHFVKANPPPATYHHCDHDDDEDSNKSMPQLEESSSAESDDVDSSIVNNRDANSDSDLGSEKGAAAAGVKQADTLTGVVISDSEMVALCNIMNQGDQTSSVNLQTLEEVIGRAEQQQLAHFKQHVDNQFAKLNRRLDRVQHCNVVEYAKKNVAAHTEDFEKAFPKLPCKSLQEIEALTTVLGCTTLAVNAVCHLSMNYKSATLVNKFMKLIFRVFVYDKLCAIIQ